MSNQSKKYLLALSGGGANGLWLTGAGMELERDMRKRGWSIGAYVATSAGCIFAVIDALRLHNKTHSLLKGLSPSMVFDRSPVDKKGRLKRRSFLNIPLYGSLGTQGNLKKTIQSMMSFEDLQRYLDSDLPDVYIGITNLSSGCIEYQTIRELGDYHAVVEAIVTSMTVAPFVRARVREGGDLTADGGYIDHIGAAAILSRTNVDAVVSVFARPRKLSAIKIEPWGKWWQIGKNLKFFAKTTSRLLDIIQFETSKNDEQMLIKTARAKNIEHFEIFQDPADHVEPFAFDQEATFKSFTRGVGKVQWLSETHKLRL